MCKQFLETKYDVIFKLINNGHVYNPLQVIKKINNEKINSSENENDIENSEFDNENSIIIAQQKRNRHSIWQVSHIEILKEYEQNNNNNNNTNNNNNDSNN